MLARLTVVLEQVNCTDSNDSKRFKTLSNLGVESHSLGHEGCTDCWFLLLQQKHHQLSEASFLFLHFRMSFHFFFLSQAFPFSKSICFVCMCVCVCNSVCVCATTWSRLLSPGTHRILLASVSGRRLAAWLRKWVQNGNAKDHIMFQPSKRVMQNVSTCLWQISLPNLHKCQYSAAFS